MSELIALTKLSAARSRRLLSFSLIYLILLHLGLAVFRSVSGMNATADRDSSLFWAVLTGSLSFPVLAVALMLFDFSDRADIGGRSSGYSHWMLRTPIQSWKLAIVPLALKTTWVLLVFALIALTSRSFGVPLESWLIASLGISSLVCGAVVLAWIPFRFNYTRLCLYALLVVPAYAAFIACMHLAYGEQMGEMPTALMEGTLIHWAIVGLFLAVVVAAIWAVTVARRNVQGCIGEKATLWNRYERSKNASAPAATGSPQTVLKADWPSGASPGQAPLRTLVRYDLAKLSGPLGSMLVLAWAVIVLFWSMADGMEASGMIFLTVVLLYPAIFACENMLHGGDRVFLPNLLAMSPISSARMVWTRQLLVSTIWLASLAGIPLILMIWKLRGSCGEFFRSWNASADTHFQSADAGWRVAVAVAMIGLVLVLRQTTWSAAIAATGKRRYALYVFVAKFLIAFAICSWLLFHFLRFPNWEAWSEWAWMRVAELPSLLPWLLMVKLTCVLGATAALARSHLTRTDLPLIALGIYGLASILTGWLFWRLIPAETLASWHAIVGAAILLPYSRITLAPLFLTFNRHR